MRFYFFSTKNWSFLEFKCIFKEVKTKRKVFGQSWTKHFQTFLSFNTISFHRKWNGSTIIHKIFEKHPSFHVKQRLKSFGNYSFWGLTFWGKKKSSCFAVLSIVFLLFWNVFFVWYLKFFCDVFCGWFLLYFNAFFPTNIYLLKVSKRRSRKRYEICSKS